MKDLTGQTLGNYEIRARLGAGGMGTVYRAYHVNLRREVALKVLNEDLLADADSLTRFTREAHTIAALEHPHIVPVYDSAAENGITYVVMRLLTGGSLADRMAQREQTNGPLPTPAEVATMTRQLADALHYAHQKGIIHRDIKGSNIMFSDTGTPFVVDFGLARLHDRPLGESLTDQGTVLGTPAYMAPEQWKSANVGPAADQYALAVLVFALLTGHLPFEAPTPHEMLHKHLYLDPPSVQAFRADLPSGLQSVLDRALEKESEDRYPSVLDFAAALENSAASAPVSGTSGFFVVQVPTTTEPALFRFTTPATTAAHQPVLPPKAAHRRRGLAALLLLAVIVIAAIAVIVWAEDGEGGPAIFRPTPLEGTPAADNEVLVLVADFHRIDEGAANIEPNIESVLRDAGVRYVRVHHEIQDREQARVVSDIYQATLVIWGEIGLGGVRIYYATTPHLQSTTLELGFQEVEQVEFSADNQQAVNAYVFEARDMRYVVQFVLGQAYYYAYDFERALTAFQAAVASLPAGREMELRASDLHALLAASWLFLPDQNRALIEANLAVELDPTNAFAYRRRAGVYFETGAADLALQDYSYAIELDDENAPNYAERAAAYMRLGRYDEALTDLHHAVQLAPQNAMYYAQRGYLFEWMGRASEALADYQKAVQLNPTSELALYYRADYYYRHQQYDLALVDYSSIIALNPTDPVRYLSRAHIYQEQGDYDRAIADFTTALELDPTSADAYQLRAIVYDLMGRVDDALADYDKFVELRPDDLLGFVSRAEYRGLHGRVDEALADYAWAIEYDPTYEYTYYSRATVYEKIGRIEDALADWNRLLEISASDLNYSYRAAFYQRQADYASALADLGEAIRLSPYVGEYRLQRANIYASAAGWQDCELALADLSEAEALSGGYLTGSDTALQVREACPAISN